MFVPYLQTVSKMAAAKQCRNLYGMILSCRLPQEKLPEKQEPLFIKVIEWGTVQRLFYG